MKSLCKTFWLFGYDLRIYADLTAQGLLQTVKSLAEEKKPNGDSIFKDYASLVVCILSHGGPGTVEGVDLESVNVSELQWAFSRGTSRLTGPDLQDKPKIFFIQACQGGKQQNPRKVSDLEKKVIKSKEKEKAQRSMYNTNCIYLIMILYKHFPTCCEKRTISLNDFILLFYLYLSFIYVF